LRTLDEDKLRTLIDVGRAVVSELDMEVLLRRVLHSARELTGARYAALGILDERREELERFLTLGVDARTRERIGELPRGKGVLGTLIREPAPLRLANVARHPSSYGFPAGHPPMKTFLGVPILVRGEAWGNLYLAEKRGGGEFEDADEHSLVVLAEWAGVGIANARLYERAAGRRTELEATLRGLETTRRIASALSGETELERVLELVAKRGRALVDARSFAVLVAGEDALRVAAVAGALPREACGTELGAESLPGRVLAAQRAERVADVAPRLRHGLGAIGVESGPALIVPLSFRGEPHGVLCAFARDLRGPEFDAEDERLLCSFAEAAATSIATARSVESERLSERIEAQEAERRRFARELHDETLQGLGALLVLLRSSLVDGTPERLRAAVGDAVGHLEGEVAALRSIISDLRPAALDQIGVGPAIETLVRRVADGSSFDVELELDLDFDAGRASTRLLPDLESTIYRVVQEGLTNVAKHAGARRVRVRVVERDGAVDVAIADDGRGFDPTAKRTGFGLVGMQERVAIAGGILDVDARPGGGTVLAASMPAQHRSPGAGRAAGALGGPG
jgi:signal transduction histidine kinase